MRSTTAFIAAHTTGWDDLVASLDRQSEAELLEVAGITADQLDAFVDLYASAASAVLVWSMGITQHRDAVDGVRAIVNLGPRPRQRRVGTVPASCRSAATPACREVPRWGRTPPRSPGALRSTRSTPTPSAGTWGFPVPDAPGLTAPEMVEAAAAGELDVLWTSGGNLLEVLPDPPSVAAALDRVPLRVHQDVVVTTQMLAEGDDVLLLPVATRYEQEGGGTSTTTERRIIFSPEIPRQVGEARSEWRLFADVASRVRPEHADAFRWATNQDLREEIARVVPAYAGIEALAATGDQVQWGGRHLCADGDFPLPDGRGRFTALEPGGVELPDGAFTVATRRGKQFNSMVHAAVDPLTGAARDAVYIDEADARALGAERRHPGAPPQRRGHLRRTPQGGPPAGPVAPGALARGQRAHLGRRRPPRAALEGPRLQRRRHRRGAGVEPHR